MRRLTHLLLVPAFMWTAPCTALAGEADIVADIASFRSTPAEPGSPDSRDQRLELVARIRSDPAFDWTEVSDYLHRAARFEPFKPATRSIRVPLESGEQRGVRIRIPKSYDPVRAWPLIIAYHGSGGNAKDFVKYVEWLLGAHADDFLIAAPHEYRQTVIDLPNRTRDEHPRVWRAVKRTVHVDSDRVYVLGYSAGAFASWTFAVTRADQLAGAVPIAGIFCVPSEGDLWDSFIPNFAHMPVLNVWGANDMSRIGGFGGRRTDGHIATLNRRLQALCESRELDVVNIEMADRAHPDVAPPREELLRLLSRNRVQYPASIDHTFRFIDHAKAYWLEGNTWEGESWDATFHQESLARFNAKPREETEEVIVQSVRGRLGRLRGQIDGQDISVTREHVGSVTIWFGEKMIDWSQPVTVTVDNRKVFEGRLERDLYLCLYHALRTYDYDRLRFAGLRIDDKGRTMILDHE